MRITPRRCLALPLLAAFVGPSALAAPPANPCSNPDVTGVKLAPPDIGAYHAAYLGPMPGGVVTDEAISAFEQRARRRVAWVQFENSWGAGGALDIRFPEASVQAIWQHGAVPFIRMMPWTTRIQEQADPVVRMKDIVDTTRYDAALRAWLLAAKATRVPIVVDFGPEVNGSWYPWNGSWNGAGARGWRDSSLPDGPEAFRLAYRKIVDMARDNGVWNITWAFHVDDTSLPFETESSWNKMRYYYPGDSYIDWIGISTFGEMIPSGDPARWPSFVDQLGAPNPSIAGGLSAYEEMERLTRSSTKPLALFEVGVVEDPRAGDKGQWIEDAYDAVASSWMGFDRVKSMNWWDERWDNTPPLGPSDMRITSSSGAQSGYRRAVTRADADDDYYVGAPRFVCTRDALP